MEGRTPPITRTVPSEAATAPALRRGPASDAVDRNVSVAGSAQAVGRSTELVAERDLAEIVALRVVLIGEVDDADADPALAPAMVVALADDEPIGPGVEPVGVPERREVLPHRDERGLDGVLGRVGVTEDPAGDEEQATRDAPSELLVRVAVARLCPFDLEPAHRPPPSVVRPDGAFIMHGAASRHSFQCSMLPLKGGAAVTGPVDARSVGARQGLRERPDRPRSRR